MEYYSIELYHHGIKGQRWGIRKYQNYDGTLTAAGKRRVAKNYKTLKKVESKIEKNNAKRDSMKKQTNSIILNKQKSDIEREQNMLLNTQIWLDQRTKDPEKPNMIQSATSFVLKNIVQPEISKYGKAFVGETIDSTLKKNLNDEAYQNIRSTITGVFKQNKAPDSKADELSKIYDLVYDYLYKSDRSNNQNKNNREGSNAKASQKDEEDMFDWNLFNQIFD